MKRLPHGPALMSKVAARWRRQYYNQQDDKWQDPRGGSSEEVYKRLRALPVTATARDVAEIIGNDSWVGHLCAECFEYKEFAVEFGHDAILCADCIRDAMAFVGS